MRYFFRVEYDGSNYNGWQRQETGVPSIQETLEKAISLITRQPCTVTGAGRTDTGVHARRQGAHTDLTLEIDERLCEKGINAVLPWDISIYNLRRVDDDFHARFSACERLYRYYISTRKAGLSYNRAWQLFQKVDWDRIREQMMHLPGKHDFKTFCATGSSNDNTVCTVRDVGLVNTGSQWVFSIAADRFVYRMVRSVVGTLVDIGAGRRGDTMDQIILAARRQTAGRTAPACGLYLENVIYPGMNS